MSEFRAKPHITRRDGRTVIEFRVGDVSAAQTLLTERANVTQLPGFGGGGWAPWGGSETIIGGWQRNIRPTKPRNILAFSAVYSCIDLIAGDWSKLRLQITEKTDDKVWLPVDDPRSPLLPVLRKPNHYQTWAQYVREYATSKLTHGNTYVLLERDNRGPGEFDGVVAAMYPLNPHCVWPLVSESGEVFYRLGKDYLAKLDDDEGTVVPASEIIHDRGECFWHPLVGVSPLFAAARAALQGLAIQDNSETFFENMSMPSGTLMIPGKISDVQARDLKKKWNDEFVGAGMGKLAILTDNMKYQQMTIPASDAQLIEQLEWTARDVAMCFHVPPYKLGLQTNTTFSNTGQQNQDYYTECLHTHLESFEQLMDNALGLPYDRRTEFDTDELLRMDPLAQADANAKRLGSGELAPNEARAKANLPPVKGGDQPFMQQQMWPIGQLVDRAPPPAAPSVPAPSAAPPVPPPSAREVAGELMERLAPALADRKSEIIVNLPADPIERMAASVATRLEELERRLGEQATTARDGISGLVRSAVDAELGGLRADLETINRAISEDRERKPDEALVNRLTEIDGKIADVSREIATRAAADGEVARLRAEQESEARSAEELAHILIRRFTEETID